jgi:hypothetical protein
MDNSGTGCKHEVSPMFVKVNLRQQRRAWGSESPLRLLNLPEGGAAHREFRERVASTELHLALVATTGVRRTAAWT